LELPYESMVRCISCLKLIRKRLKCSFVRTRLKKLNVVVRINITTVFPNEKGM